MKKIIFIFIIVVLFSFVFINKKQDEKKVESTFSEKEEMRALFVSYLELNTYIQDKSIEESKKNINKIINNTKKNKFNTIILQVRSYDDAIYKTKNFPVSKSIILNSGSYYDVLKCFLKLAKKSNINVYVWINPFRITRPNEELIPNSYAYKYKDTTVVKKVGEIYYYNPARNETTTHVVDGIKELIKKYEFKGILFDDYFYPSDDIDSFEFDEYKKTNITISLKEYHLSVINRFIKTVYKEIKNMDKNIEFGISPDGNIDNNYNKTYVDIKTLANSSGYIDFLMPQLYYGFENSQKPFIETANSWSSLVKNDKIKLYYALAFYKVGKEDNYAKAGINEWVENNDIIKKQVLVIKNINNYQGFSLFRYDNLFNKNLYTNTSISELDNLFSTLKK